MSFQVARQLNPIGAMKSFMKPNCSLFLEERLTLLLKLHDKNITIMNKNPKYTGRAVKNDLLSFFPNH